MTAILHAVSNLKVKVMVASDSGIGHLVEVLQRDGEARTRELADLNAQLEERNRLLQRQLGNKVAVARWFGLLGVLLALLVGVWVYQLMQRMSGDIDNMATKIAHMQVYMKNMGGGQLNEGEAGFMSSIARNTDSMSADIGAMRKAMQQVSNDMGDMRLSMEQTRANIGSMNQVMGDMGNDMKSVTGNIAVMARSVGHMNQNVGRLSRDSQYMGDPLRAWDSVMPWR